jgi:hypothetical protein
VTGDVSDHPPATVLFRVSHSAMAARSYEWPSDNLTGSVIVSPVIGQVNASGTVAHASLEEEAGSSP